MRTMAWACLCLVLPAFAAHATVDGREAASGRTLPVAADRAGDHGPDATPATGAREKVRRSTMAAVEPEGRRPEMRFAFMHREVGTDPGTRGDCLKGTGSRVKRDTSGVGACVIGNGQVYKVEH